ncbi:hypothetical protein [Catellatospora bangladeshensis]|uniref:Uncharacterized protein n=1 Tax=Catellatospora bangladeshensis TaxID=310355 RepID=A0A8J3JNY3_9ACTN|nr:hypothetical protein [Catellatospora bangladeshensis]GIF80634.1 hypothetical protein Cba03nite_19830 [Catellatospora bangladeshensis]
MTAPRNEPLWFVADGSRVVLGSEVRLDDGPGVYGVVVGVDPGHGMPVVEVLSGPQAGQVRRLWPGQIPGLRGAG